MQAQFKIEQAVQKLISISTSEFVVEGDSFVEFSLANGMDAFVSKRKVPVIEITFIIAALLRKGMLFILVSDENMIPVATMICERSFEKKDAVYKADLEFSKFADLLTNAATEAMFAGADKASVN